MMRSITAVMPKSLFNYQANIRPLYNDISKIDTIRRQQIRKLKTEKDTFALNINVILIHIALHLDK